jgi:hypothetical protein
MTTWRVSSQDYRSWRTAHMAQPRPELRVRDFGTLEEAEAEADLRRAQGLTVCVSPTPPPRRTRRRPLPLETGA